mgnify:FL=1
MNLDAWLDYIANQHQQTIDMGLSRTEEMVRRMELRQPARRVVTVAGTNGKGSTITALESLLVKAGLRVLSTLSPHVVRFNERLRLNGMELSDDAICAAFAEIEQARQLNPVVALTYFEFAALAALWCARQKGVDVVLLEIGLGGRLDAFNVIDADIAVITSIGIDHEKFLGNTRDAIGAEKAGILRFGQRVVLGPDMPASVLSRCRELNVQPLRAGDDFVVSEGSGPLLWTLSWGRERLVNLPMGNLAPSNIALAHQAALGLTQISSAQMRETSAQAYIPGRMQQLRYRGRLLVHDVSHNPAAAKFLCHQLAQRDLQPKHVLCAMLADKDHAAVYAAVANFTAAPWTLVDTRGERGFSAAQLANAMQIECDQAPDMPTALHQALACTQPDDVILVFGSFNAIEQSLWLRSHGDAL